MCFAATTPDKRKLTELVRPKGFAVEDFTDIFHANAFTRPLLPILANDAAVVRPAKWKLIPAWVKTESDADRYATTQNARGEEIFEKPTFKPYTRQTCLVFVQGFFEPNHPAPKKTIPYFVSRQDGNPLALGGLFADWTNRETGLVTRTFTIITVGANRLLARVHNEGLRMPLILNPEQWPLWLGHLDTPEALRLIEPYPDGILQAYPVSNELYKRNADTDKPEILNPLGETLK